MKITYYSPPTYYISISTEIEVEKETRIQLDTCLKFIEDFVIANKGFFGKSENSFIFQTSERALTGSTSFGITGNSIDL